MAKKDWRYDYSGELRGICDTHSTVWYVASNVEGCHVCSAESGRSAPRYKVGDRVRFRDCGNTVDSLIMALHPPQREWEYQVNGFGWKRESELTPVPVVCAPDGTRCARFVEQVKRTAQQEVEVPEWWQYAPHCAWCGGNLREG